MVDEWLQIMLAVSFNVSSQCVSCELKFFTGNVCWEACLMVEQGKLKCLHIRLMPIFPDKMEQIEVQM